MSTTLYNILSHWKHLKAKETIQKQGLIQDILKGGGQVVKGIKNEINILFCLSCKE